MDVLLLTISEFDQINKYIHQVYGFYFYGETLKSSKDISGRFIVRLDKIYKNFPALENDTKFFDKIKNKDLKYKDVVKQVEGI